MICKGPFATYHNAANEFERKSRFLMHKEISMHNMENVKKKSNIMIWLLSIITKE